MEARAFSSSTTYTTGDLCLYDGVLYRFISDHSAGAWDSADVIKVDNNTEQELTRIIAAYDAAVKAGDFAETLVFEASQISGTRYKYTFTNAPDPR